MTMFSLEVIGSLLLAILLGGLIGYERERFGKEAGMRTHALVTLGSTLFTLASQYGFHGQVDTARVASYIVVGIGFLGGGIIMQHQGRVFGMTTAAGLWVAAALGILIGIGWYMLAVVVTLIVYIVLYLSGLLPEAKAKTAKTSKNR